jgi:predicted Zn-dependent peptidase
VLFTGSFESVFEVPNELTKVTPAQVRAFASKYLVNTNRTIINRVPAPANSGAANSGGAQ